ncbi:MAG: autotransporter domain-containing protein, partial [Burkholderiaceae bacterium]
QPNAAFAYRFGQTASPLSLASKALTVKGNLTLGSGSKLNLPVSPSLSDIGYNRVINYSGTLTNNGFIMGDVAPSIPVGYTYAIDTAPAHGIDLLVQPNGFDVLQVWAGTSGDKSSGTWNASNPNWDNLGGTSLTSWMGAYGIFRGPGGTVTLAGDLPAVGLQFAAGNYTLTGSGTDRLTLHGYSAPGFSITTPDIRVLAGETATIDVPIKGIAGFAKTGDGVLILGGSNEYTGSTRINGGMLQVSRDDNLGDSSNAVTLDKGALRTTAAFDTNRAISLTDAAGFDVASGTTLGLTGTINGAGGMVKMGSGTLALKGVGDWAGGTWITDGAVSAQGAGALPPNTPYLLTGGTLALNNHDLTMSALAGTGGNIDLGTTGGLTVDQSGDTWYGGTISGPGTALTKTGAGTLLLTGANTHTATRIQGGTLAIIADTALGDSGGTVALSNGATLATLANIDSSRQLNLAGDGVIHTLSGTTFSTHGALAGTGLLTKTGEGTLQLQGAGLVGATGDTAVEAGTLRLTDMTALRDGTVNISGNATLALAPAAAGDQIFSNPMTGSGTVAANLAASSDSMKLVDTSGGFSGTFAMGRGSLSVNGANTQALAHARLRADAGSLINVGSGTQAIGGLAYNGGTTVFDTTVPADAGANGILSVNALDVSGNGALRVALPSLPLPNPGPAGSVNLLSQDDTVLVKGVHSSGPVVGSAANLLLQDTSGQAISSARNFAIAQQGQTMAVGTYDYRATTGTGDGLYIGYGLKQVSVDAGKQLLLKPDAGDTGTARDFSARVSGAGGLVVEAGAGQMVSLSNAGNEYTGRSQVLSGTLAIAAGGQLSPASVISLGTGTALDLSGATASQNAAGLESVDASANVMVGTKGFSLGDANDHVYRGSIQGASLTKQGIGKQVLDGPASVSSVTVKSGTLIVGANAGSPARISGDVDVMQAGTFGGHGTVIGDLNVASGGTLAPGNSIGTINVAGNASLAKGSVLDIETRPDGASDKLLVSGAVDLGGATLRVTADQGAWAPRTIYTIVQAGALTGAFDTVTSNLAFLYPQVTYTNTTANLGLLRNDLNFASIARTHNQRASAGGIESLGVQSPIYDAILGMSEDGALEAYDNLSGEIHASTTTALLDDSRYLRLAITQHLRGDDLSQDKAASPAAGGTTAWAQGYGGWGGHADTGNTARLSHDTIGVVLGADMPLNEHWRAGAAGAFAYDRLAADARNSDATLNSYSLAAYLGGRFDQWRLRAGTAYSWSSINTKRRIDAAAVGGTARAKYDASTVQVFGEAGYEMTVGDFKVEPYAGLAYVGISSDGFTESGSIAALKGDSTNHSVVYGTLGVHLKAPTFDIGKAAVNTRLTLGWQHAFGKVDPSRTLAFSGGSPYSVDGAPLGRDTALVRVGAQARLTKSSSVSLDYVGQYGGGYQDSGVRLNLRVAF